MPVFWLRVCSPSDWSGTCIDRPDLAMQSSFPGEDVTYVVTAKQDLRGGDQNGHYKMECNPGDVSTYYEYTGDQQNQKAIALHCTKTVPNAYSTQLTSLNDGYHSIATGVEMQSLDNSGTKTDEALKCFHMVRPSMTALVDQLAQRYPPSKDCPDIGYPLSPATNPGNDLYKDMCMMPMKAESQCSRTWWMTRHPYVSRGKGLHSLAAGTVNGQEERPV